MEAVKEQDSGQQQREAENEAADAGFEDEDEEDGIIEVRVVIILIVSAAPVARWSSHINVFKVKVTEKKKGLLLQQV